ncbi:uncharacterized protein LOC143361487 isoform X1 [Halictus rubicundus]|uniref:uncharacterized protein LOC143361487 isoform X1 n=1 Tax=Halictus rubicundus TaxID=77578 RepID=UPI0040371847
MLFYISVLYNTYVLYIHVMLLFTVIFGDSYIRIVCHLVFRATGRIVHVFFVTENRKDGRDEIGFPFEWHKCHCNREKLRRSSDILQPQSNSKFIVSPTSMSLNMLKALDVSRMSDVSEFSAKHLTAVSEQFVNVSVSFFKTYGWLIKAAICGLIMTGFSWYIIYKDSSIPGIDPPSPFSPSKQRFTRETSNVQLNYLVGVLNGLLIFVYLCL